MVRTMSTKFDPIEIRRIACDAMCDPRTVAKELDEPESVRGIVGLRVRRELEKRGLREPKEVA